VKSCLIDGELVVCNEQGLAVFELLRGRQVTPPTTAGRQQL
jgi:ATP-dependent DNA ligase